jgi:hypothetical protein
MPGQKLKRFTTAGNPKMATKQYNKAVCIIFGSPIYTNENIGNPV